MLPLTPRRRLTQFSDTLLATVVGTGPGGIITRQDVLGGVGNESPTSESDSGARLTRNQTAVARAVLRSWREIPHFYVGATIDMTATQQFREKAKETGACPSYDAIFLKAMGRALVSFPQFGSRLEGDLLQSSRGIHIALAVGTQTELFLPVLRDVNKKTLKAIHAEICELSSKAATGTFSSDDLAGGCIGLSNLGMYDIEEFEAIIFPGHSAVLAVGSVQEKPVAVDHHVEVRPLVNFQLAADHRLVNGRAAAEFLCMIKHSIETGDFA